MSQEHRLIAWAEKGWSQWPCQACERSGFKSWLNPKFLSSFSWWFVQVSKENICIFACLSKLAISVKEQESIPETWTISPRDTSRLFIEENMLVDIKVMTEGFDDFIYLLVTTSEIINFFLVIPIKSTTAEFIAKAFYHSNKFSPLIMFASNYWKIKQKT